MGAALPPHPQSTTPGRFAVQTGSVDAVPRSFVASSVSFQGTIGGHVTDQLGPSGVGRHSFLGVQSTIIVVYKNVLQKIGMSLDLRDAKSFVLDFAFIKHG